MGLLKDFKAFAMKGNVIDLATAVIIGNEFGKIVSSVVNDILMPPLGILLGKVDFKELKLIIQQAGTHNMIKDGKMITAPLPEVAINYGVFIQNIINFIIIAFCIFLVVKIYHNALKKKDADTEAVKPTNEEVLLTEIRDLLKKKIS